MATLIETWLKTDLQHVVTVQELSGNLFSADSNANRIGVILMNKGRTVPITGGISGYVIRPDDATLVISGSAEGNRAWIDLPASAYVHTGPIHIVIKNGNTTIGACSGYVRRSTTDTIVDPGHVIPTISDLLAEIENMRDATSAANTATANANSATSAANTAATNANSKASAANTAAENANSKATSANTAATNANTAATKINDMTIVATQGDPSLPPSALLELVNGHYRITFSNIKGLKGDTGDAFHIVKTYSSIAQMQADYSGTDTHIGDYVMVVNSVEDPDNAKVYIKGSSSWQFIVDMSGATGIKGDTGNGIASVSFSDYCLTLNFTDGTSYTTTSIRGEPGDATIDDNAGIGDDEYVWSADKVKKELDKKSADFSPVILRDYPETIKTLENCAENMGMGFEIPISPVQDLHGYANPWVGGAGKNLLDITKFGTASTGATASVSNGELHFVGNGESNYQSCSIPASDKTYSAGTYYIKFKFKSGAVIPSGAVFTLRKANGHTTTFKFSISSSTLEYEQVLTITEDCYASFVMNFSTGSSYASDFTVYDFIISTTDVPFEPYTNICPLSGFDGVDITRTGINLLYTVGQTNGYYLNASGVPGSDSSFCYTDLIPVKAGQNYYISGKSTKTDVSNRRIHEYDANGTWLRQLQVVSVAAGDSYSYDMTISSDACYVKVSYPGNTVGGRTDLDLNPKFVEKNIFQFTWQSSAGTVYGGTVTINEDGSGKLIVDRKKVNVSDCNWTYVTSDNYFWTSIPEIKRGVLNVVTEKLTSDSYVADIPNRVATASGTNGTMSVGIANPYLMIRDYRFTNNTTFKQNSGASVVYELASPVSYDLTPQQITSLFGTNTVWNSIGMFSMSYHLDPKVYVDDTAGMAGSIEKSDSTEASVKTLSDGADNLPMEVEVAINPVQDLHGYANPWAGGAGKNIAPVTVSNIKSANTLGTWVANVYTQANVEFTILTDDAGNVTGIKANGTPNANIGFYIFKDKTIPTGTYTLTGSPVDATTSQDVWLGTFANDAYRDFDYGTGASVVLASDTTLSLRFRIASGKQVSNVVIKPMIRLSTESDTFAPYSNICPISGWDSVNIVSTSKNLFGAGLSAIDETVSLRPNAGQRLTMSTIDGNPNDIVCTGNGSWLSGFYVIHGIDGTQSYAFSYEIKDNTFSSGTPAIKKASASYQTEDQLVVLVTIDNSSSANGSIKFKNIQVEAGTTITDFVSFGKKHSISLPTTAYGGTLTVNKDGSGRLVLTHAKDTATSSNTIMRTGGFRFYYNQTPVGNKSNDQCVISDRIPTATDAQLVNIATRHESFCYIHTTSGGFNFNTIKEYASVADMISDIGEIQFVYELATPVVFDFTAQQIRSFLGENNLWADSGNVLNVIYRADQGLYISKIANEKADKTDTVLESTLSRGRKESTTIGTGSFAFGSDVEASGDYSHAEGNNTQALGESSHAEGESSIVDEVAMAAHAEGNDTRASATYAHAEGWSTTAVGSASHAEGYESVASARFAHAEGSSTLASGMASHSEGANTVANHKAQHVGGEFNVEDPSSANVGDRGNYVEIIGNGTGSSAKSNARALDWNGNEYIKGDLYVNCNADSTNGTKIIPLPAVSSSDNGKVLRVVDGVWSAVSLPSASGVSF